MVLYPAQLQIEQYWNKNHPMENTKRATVARGGRMFKLSDSTMLITVDLIDRDPFSNWRASMTEANKIAYLIANTDIWDKARLMQVAVKEH